MSKLVQVKINKGCIIFYGVTQAGENYFHHQVIDGSCDDEKWFDLVCEFWDNDCELDWDEVEKLLESKK